MRNRNESEKTSAQRSLHEIPAAGGELQHSRQLSISNIFNNKNSAVKLLLVHVLVIYQYINLLCVTETWLQRDEHNAPQRS